MGIWELHIHADISIYQCWKADTTTAALVECRFSSFLLKYGIKSLHQRHNAFSLPYIHTKYEYWISNGWVSAFACFSKIIPIKLTNHSVHLIQCIYTAHSSLQCEFQAIFPFSSKCRNLTRLSLLSSSSSSFADIFRHFCENSLHCSSWNKDNEPRQPFHRGFRGLH